MNEEKKATWKAALRTIEELAKAEDVSPAIFAGAAATEGWQVGKMVSAEDFRKAVKRFLGQPIDGRTK